MKEMKCCDCKYLKRHMDRKIKYTCPYAPGREYWGLKSGCELNVICGHFERQGKKEK